MNRKLYRSSKDHMLCGVCGGLGEYLNVDPTIIRLIWAICTVCTLFFGIVAYLAAAIIIPSDPNQ